MHKFNWATFENHWDLLLSYCAKGKKETKAHHSHNFYENAY